MDGKKIKINSKLGTFEVDQSEVIRFADSPLGYPHLKDFILIEENDSIFLWLQSIEDQKIAFPMLEVQILGLNKSEFINGEINGKLEAKSINNLSVYTIVSIPANPQLMTANFKAPVIINEANKLGLQTILSNPTFEIAKPIFVELKRRMAGSASDDTRVNSQNQNSNVTAQPSKSKAQAV